MAPSRVKRPRQPSALTETRVSKICELVARGVPQQAAAGSLGIPKRTFQNWLEIGRRPEAVEPYRSLADRLETAKDKFHASRAVVVGDAPDARTTLQVLERRFPADWADPNRGGVTVNVGVIVESPEWRALSARLLDVLAPFPDALDAVLVELGGGVVVEGEAVEVGVLAA